MKYTHLIWMPLFPVLLSALLFLGYGSLWLKTFYGPSIETTFFSVGQGDCSLVVTPEGRRILVDAGPEEDSALNALNTLMGQLDRHIDLIVLTHPHKDHVQGVYKVLESYNVGAVLINEESDTPLYAQLQKLAEEKHVPVLIANPAQDILVDAYSFIDIIAPTNLDDESLTKNLNNTSLVFLLRSGQHTELFSGDAEQEEESAILKEGTFLQAELLKGGHHGSRTSSTLPYLKAIAPKNIVYMNGVKNQFHHPHEETLEKLRTLKIPFFNTSISGTVHATCSLEKIDCTISSDFPYEHSDTS